MKKLLMPILFMVLSNHLFSQGMSFKIEPPIVNNFSLIPTQLQPGSTVTYEVTGAESFQHTFSVLEEKEVEGKVHVRLHTVRDLPQRYGLAFTLPLHELIMANASEIEAQTPMGNFNINDLSGNGVEKVVKRSKQTISVLGKEHAVERIDFEAGSERKGTIWVKKGLGPLGIAKAEIHRAGKTYSYTLVSIGSNKEDKG